MQLRLTLYISKTHILQEAHDFSFSEFLIEESKISLFTNLFSTSKEKKDALYTNDAVNSVKM
jgi:hypothetical protein